MEIAILMSTYNGEKFLDEQLNSIWRQKVNSHVTVYIRDDGSQDGTIEIIEDWKKKIDIELFIEENIGPAKSFWELLVSKNIEADFFAFCDQDDIWDDNKLEIGIKALMEFDDKVLWCSNCRIIDKKGIVIDNEMNSLEPDFSVISQFVCGTTQGCAMIFNDKLRRLIMDSEISCIPMHDFVIMVYASTRGRVIYEDSPTFSYRVHTNNVVAKSGKNRFRHYQDSLKRWFSSEHKNELTRFAEIFLNDNFNYLDETTINFLKCFVQTKSNFLSRVKIISDSKVKSENKSATRSFKIRTFFGII